MRREPVEGDALTAVLMMLLGVVLLMGACSCGEPPATQLDDALLEVDVVDAGAGQCVDPRECYVPDPTNPCGRGTEDREACDRLFDGGKR